MQGNIKDSDPIKGKSAYKEGESLGFFTIFTFPSAIYVSIHT